MCPEYKSENIEEGKIDNVHGVVVKLKSSFTGFKVNKTSPISVKVCLDCGAIFDFKVTNLKKISE